jgi:hypothetical protein
MPLQWATDQVKIRTLVSEIQSGHYDIHPPHQRNMVHDLDWKRELITSIFEPPCAIPETWWHPRIKEDGREVSESVDGKQRISTIVQYAKGEFTWKGKLFDALLPAEQNQFMGHSLSLRIANRTLTPAEVSRIFKKLAMTKRTTLGEILNAEVGPFREDMRLLLLQHGSMIRDIFRNRDRFQDLEAYAKGFDYLYRLGNPGVPTRCGEANDVIETWQRVSTGGSSYNLTVFEDLIGKTWDIFRHGQNRNIPRKMNATTWLPVFCLLCETAIDKHEAISNYLKEKLATIVENETMWPKVGGNHDCVATRKHTLRETFQTST